MGRRSRSAASPTTTARWSPARCSSACPASRATATTSRPTRWRAAPRRWSSRGRSASACPRCRSRTCAPRWPSAAARFYGDPTRRLPVVGVTGTNGKTTTAFLVRSLLEAAGRQCGLLGTVTSVVAGEERPTVRTTPEAIDLQRTFREMLDGGDTACAMEISSHALELRRADGDPRGRGGLHEPHAGPPRLPSDDGGLLRAKRRLFASPLTDVRVVNVDDPYGRRLAEEFPDAVTFAIDADADYRAADVRTGFAGTDCTFETPDGAFDVHVPLPGRFNVANALGAWAAARALGRPADVLAAALPDAARVPGRFEPVDEGQPFAVLVDYAHTPDSLENVLRAARELADGPRDRGVRRGRRPRPRQAAADGRDRRAAGRRRAGHLRQPALRGPGGDHRRDPRRDRRRRERRARRRPARERSTAPIALAEPGDVVVIAGKGHEQGQEFAGGRKEPFDDVAVAREALRSGRHEGLGRGAGRGGGGRDARARRARAGRRAWSSTRASRRAGRPVRRPDRRERRRRPVRGRRAGGRRLGRAGRRRRGRRLSRAAPCSPPTTRWRRWARWRASGGGSSAPR